MESIRASLGLDKSKPEQFVNYIGDILPFVGGDGINFGFSYQNDTEVLPGILERLPATIVLAGGAVILWLMIGIPIGMISAVKTGSVWDRLAMGLALIAISAPVYFLGLVDALPVRRRHRQVPDPARQLGLQRGGQPAGRSSPR